MTKAKPQQQESWREEYSRILHEWFKRVVDLELNEDFIGRIKGEKPGFWVVECPELEDFISTQRTQILNEVRWLVEGMGTYRTAKNIETVNKHDLLQAIEKLKEEHE